MWPNAARIYEEGDVVTPDITKAFVLYSLSVEFPRFGQSQSDDRDRIQKRLTARQLGQAEALLRKWHEEPEAGMPWPHSSVAEVLNTEP